MQRFIFRRSVLVQLPLLPSLGRTRVARHALDGDVPRERDVSPLRLSESSYTSTQAQ